MTEGTLDMQPALWKWWLLILATVLVIKVIMI
jgi:hypothetical protein